jgi:hypothetical protein
MVKNNQQNIHQFVKIYKIKMHRFLSKRKSVEGKHKEEKVLRGEEEEEEEVPPNPIGFVDGKKQFTKLDR